MASLARCLPGSSHCRPFHHVSEFPWRSLFLSRTNTFLNRLPRSAVTPPLRMRRREVTRICCTNSASDEGASLSEVTTYLELNNFDNDKTWKLEVWVAIGATIVAVGVALSIFLRRGHLLANSQREASQLILDLSSSVSSSHEPAGFNVNWFGHRFSLSERSPGWMYFLLLMAAGFGLFVSEEALNVWVGGTLGRCLTWNQSQEAFISSISANLPYVLSTILWVYWGVCISDMVPFFAGRLAAKTGTGNAIREKLGVSQEKFDQVQATVQRYGNLIGIVERFSLGVRNPTSFLAGFVGIKPINYFGGVCVGALLTLPLQMGVGLILRDRPVAALAGVAAAVGFWTIFPYAAAGIASAIFVLRQCLSQQSS